MLAYQVLNGSISGAGDIYQGFVESAFLGSVSERCANGVNEVSQCTFDNSKEMRFFVGLTFAVEGTLTASASSNSDSFASVSYLSTAHYYIDILTPGITLSSTSGYSYQPALSEAPEPASVTLVFPGFAGLMFLVVGGVRKGEREEGKGRPEKDRQR